MGRKFKQLWRWSLVVAACGAIIGAWSASSGAASTTAQHRGKPPARHVVHISQGSLIARLAGRSEVEVNSYHHQSVQNPGRNLRPVAFAPDGIIEAVEDATGRFIIGVQWHPERGWKDDPFSQALFTSFIDEARLRYNESSLA